MNEATVLRCSCDRIVEWNFYAVGKSVGEDIYVYKHSNVTPDYEKSMYVNRTDAGQYDLCINETKPTNAGTYVCMCDGEDFRAQLIIIDDLNCSIQDQRGSDIVYLNANESLYMTCIAEYWSDWDPLLNWSSCDNRTFDANITYFSNHSKVSFLIFQCYSTNLANLPIRFVFRIHFLPQQLTIYDAMNAPGIILISPIISLRTS